MCIHPIKLFKSITISKQEMLKIYHTFITVSMLNINVDAQRLISACVVNMRWPCGVVKPYLQRGQGLLLRTSIPTRGTAERTPFLSYGSKSRALTVTFRGPHHSALAVARLSFSLCFRAEFFTSAIRKFWLFFVTRDRYFYLISILG